MTAADWQGPGRAEPHALPRRHGRAWPGPDGGDLLDDDFLVLINAWWEPLQFTVAATRTAQVWLAEIDTSTRGASIRQPSSVQHMR